MKFINDFKKASHDVADFAVRCHRNCGQLNGWLGEVLSRTGIEIYKERGEHCITFHVRNRAQHDKSGATILAPDDGERNVIAVCQNRMVLTFTTTVDCDFFTVNCYNITGSSLCRWNHPTIAIARAIGAGLEVGPVRGGVPADLDQWYRFNMAVLYI